MTSSYDASALVTDVNILFSGKKLFTAIYGIFLVSVACRKSI